MILNEIFDKITDKLAELSTRKFLAVIGSSMIVLLLIEAFLISIVIESIYVNEVYNNMYDYVYVDCNLEEDTTFFRPLIIQDGMLVKGKINRTTRVDMLSIKSDWMIMKINITINIAIVEGSIIITNIAFVHQPDPNKLNRVYVDCTISTINTTIDRWNLQTTTFFFVSIKTSDIANGLGIYVPFWLL